MKGIKKLLSYVTKVEYAIMIIAFIAMVAAYFVAVINRNFIKASMPWTEEVAMYSMIYMALLGTEVGLRPPIGASPPPGFLMRDPTIMSAPTSEGSTVSTNSP